MNTKTIRNLIIAAPLATAALTVAPAAAMATEPGPVVLKLAPAEPKPELDIAIPKPKPVQPKGPQDIAIPKPKPKGPQDKAPAPKPVEPKGPGDIAIPKPKPTQPKGPGDLTNPAPCPTHGVDCTPDKGGDEPTGGNGSGGNGGNGGGGNVTAEGVDEVSSFSVPNRIDAGLAADDQGGLELAWLLAGGALVTASGIAFAARNRVRRAV